MKRLIEFTDLWIGVNLNGDAHVFCGDEPTLEGNGVFCGMLLAYLVSIEVRQGQHYYEEHFILRCVNQEEADKLAWAHLRSGFYFNADHALLRLTRRRMRSGNRSTANDGIR